MMQFLKLTGNLETAIHGAGKKVKMSGTRELLLLDKYIKVGHIFSQLLRNKMAHTDHGNTETRTIFMLGTRLGFGETATKYFHFRNIEREDISVYQKKSCEN